jgi:hypothetical protein
MCISCNTMQYRDICLQYQENSTKMLCITKFVTYTLDIKKKKIYKFDKISDLELHTNCNWIVFSMKFDVFTSIQEWLNWSIMI